MDLIYPDNGLITYLLNGVSPSGINYHLFKNDVTPDLSYTIGSFVEADFTGYAEINVASASFTTTTIVAHRAVCVATPIAFVCTFSTQVIFGFFATDSSDTYLIQTGRFDTPFTVSTTTPLVLTPLLGGYSLLQQ